MEAEDPLELHGWQLPGNPELMLRLLVEEYARFGCSAEQILAMAQDGWYSAFYALRQQLGEQRFAGVVHETMARCGQARVSVWQRPAFEEPDLYEIEPWPRQHAQAHSHAGE